MSNKPRLFIAIATEERIANIPPILEMKNTNEDQILWLVSSEAKNKNWVDKPSELLKNLGVTSFAKVVEVEDDPDDCAKAVAAELEKAIYSRFEKVLVGNGGQKPTLLALSHALPQGTPLIYGQAQPAELWFWGQGIRGGKQRIPYRKARLTLDEVLACRGYKKMSNNAKQFWPAAAAAAVQNNIDWMDCSAGQYGIDHDTTLKAHQRYRTLAALPDTKDGKINPRAAEHLLPDEFNAWKTQMLEACASRNGTNQQQLTALFFLAQAVAKKARGVRDASKNKNESEQNGIGRAFELAVARRVRGWLTDRAREITNFPVLEAWWNTEIKRIGSSTADAEFDIALVLTNGIILSLECKSHVLGEKKDIDARIFNLQQASTGLALFSICGPLYTEFADDEFYKTTRDLKANLPSSIKFIPFTLAKQAKNFDCKKSFEEELDELIKPYCPKKCT